MLNVASPAGSALTARLFRADRGCEPGQPDMLLLEEGADGAVGLAIELKIGDNGLQPAQVRWFARLRARRWRCEVIKSLDRFQAVVSEHLGLGLDGGAAGHVMGAAELAEDGSEEDPVIAF